MISRRRGSAQPSKLAMAAAVISAAAPERRGRGASRAGHGGSPADVIGSAPTAAPNRNVPQRGPACDVLHGWLDDALAEVRPRSDDARRTRAGPRTGCTRSLRRILEVAAAGARLDRDHLASLGGHRCAARARLLPGGVSRRTGCGVRPSSPSAC